MELAAQLKNFKINGQIISWTVNKLSEEKSLGEYLNENVQFSNRLIKLAKTPEALLSVNGKKRTVKYIVTEGDQIVVRFPEEVNETTLKATELPLDIIYEDDHLMVLNKGAQQVTVPSVKQRETSLANGILHYYYLHNLPYTVHIVTRLDRDTSGLVLVAKHRYAHALLANLQSKNEIDRTYVGFVEGCLQKKAGTINLPIGRKAYSIIEREVNNTGQKAITHYKVIKDFIDYSYLEIKLETGRTHQIRVHFSSVGHPLLGDDLYGKSSKDIKRQALHCQKLEMTHPITGEKLFIEAPLPHDLQAIFDK